MQCVVEHEANISGHGQLYSAFEKVRMTFIENLPPSTVQRHSLPGVNTLHNKFITIVSYRRSVYAANSRASGISEEITQTGEVLYYLILRRDSEYKMKKVKRQKASEKEVDFTQKDLYLRL